MNENARAIERHSAELEGHAQHRPLAGYPGACLFRYALSTVLVGMTARTRASRRPNAGASMSWSARIDAMPRIAIADEAQADVLPISSRHRDMADPSSIVPASIDTFSCQPYTLVPSMEEFSRS